VRAPDRIWVNLDNNDDSCCPVEDQPQGDGRYFHAPTATEYVRADLAPQWQDIATAPKDSTIYLGTTEGNQQAFWCEGGNGYWANPINGGEIHGDAYKWLRDVKYGPTPPECNQGRDCPRRH